MGVLRAVRGGGGRWGLVGQWGGEKESVAG